MNSLKMPLHEAIDRFTILTLKRERLRDETDRPVVEKEYDFYKSVVDAYREEDIEVQNEWVKDLTEINAKCWSHETEVRLGRVNGLTLAEVGARMIALRDFNKVRIGLKNRIMEESGLDFTKLDSEENTQLKTPLPETIEKVGILTLKLSGARDETERRAFTQERDFYNKVLDAYRADSVAIKVEWVEELKDINAQSWAMEADITLGREDLLGLEEVGRRTLLLRDMNKLRIGLKKKIAEHVGLGFYEIKTETT